MQTGNGTQSTENELQQLRGLDNELREAIRTSLRDGQPELAVALDTARDFLETVIAEEQPAVSRIAVARARVDIALAVWRRMNRAATEATASAG